MPAAETTVANIRNTLVATLPHRQKQLHDEWHKDHVFLFFMREMGGFNTGEVDPSIQIPLNVVEDPTVSTRGISAPVPLQDVQHLRAAEFLGRVQSGAATLNEFELSGNKGQMKILDLFDAREHNLMLTMKDVFNKQMLQATGSGDDFNGLPLIVSDTPTTGTVGGINRATAGNEYWRNQSITAVGSFAANGLANLRSLRNLVNTGSINHRTSFNITTSDVYNAYELTQSSNVRYQGPLSAKMGDAGLASMEWNGQPVAWDDAVLSGHWYMLNFENLGFVAAPEFQFTYSDLQASEATFSISQKIALFGQLTTNNPRYLGVMSGITA